MSEEIKSVRIRPRQEPPGYKSGAFEGGRLDYKVKLMRLSRRERQCFAMKISTTGEESSVAWFNLEYKGRRYEDMTDDEIIADYIRTNTVRENPSFKDGNIDMYVETFSGSGVGSTQSVPYYEIIQDPFEKTPPASRVFGRDPYYLNNGAKVYINWFSGTSVKVSYLYENITTSTQSQSGEVSIRISTNEPEIPPNEYTYNSQNNPFGVGATPSYINIENYWENELSPGGSTLFVGWKKQGETYIDPNTLHPVEGVFYGSTSSASYAIDGYIDDARIGIGGPTPSISIKPNPLIKRVRVEPPTTEFDSSSASSDARRNVNFKTWVLSNETSDTISSFHPIYIEDSVEYQGTQSSGTSSTTETGKKKKEKQFLDKSADGNFSIGQDWMILGDLINAWKNKIPNYDLKLNNPSFLSPSIYDEIKYKDPVSQEPEVEESPPEQIELVENVNLKVYFPPEWEVKVREDCPEFKIFVGEIPKELEPGEGFQFQDDFEYLEGYDPEYSEAAFASEEEQIDFILSSEFSESDGEEFGDSVNSGEVSSVETNSKTATSSAKTGDGSGIRRFQKTLEVSGRTVKNGELPDNLLTKLDFCGHRIEKNAARQLNKLNVAFKNKFGQNISVTDGYRRFAVQEKIFDWDYFDTGKNTITGNIDPKGKGRKKGSFTNNKKTGVAASKPGTSLHGWGQAIDCSGFGDGPGNKYFDWMEENAKNYGFINPPWAKKKGTAGYEPWHWEYNGTDLFKS